MNERYVTREFPRKDIEELLWGGDVPGYEIVVDANLDGTSRWAKQMHTIFRHDGSLWRIDWETGATEYQEVDQLPYGPIAYQVVPRTVETVVYDQVVSIEAEPSEPKPTYAPYVPPPVA